VTDDRSTLGSDVDRVLVAGASGKTGRHVLEVLDRRGYEPLALTRSSERANHFHSRGVESIAGDLLVARDARRAVRTADAAITCVGSSPVQVLRGQVPGGGPDRFVDGAGNAALARAADGAGLEALVMTSSLGVGGDRGSWMASLFGIAIEPVVAAKARGERAIREADLDHVVVRPGALLDRLSPLAVGEVRTAPAGTGVWGLLDRRTLAELLVAALSTPGARNETIEVTRNPFGSPDARTFDWDLGE